MPASLAKYAYFPEYLIDGVCNLVKQGEYDCVIGSTAVSYTHLDVYKRQRLYYYRPGREGSLSNSVRRDLFQIQKDSFSYLKEFLKKSDIWTKENADIYYGLYWDRLFMTWKQLRKVIPEITEDPVWETVWKECRTRKLCTWKRRLKRCCLRRKSR